MPCRPATSTAYSKYQSKLSLRLRYSRNVVSTREGVLLGSPRQLSDQGKAVSQVHTAYLGVGAKGLGRACPENAPFVNDVGTISHRQGLADVVVSNKNSDACRLQVGNDFL